MPNQKRIDRGVALMNKVKLLSYIDDPQSKNSITFFNFDRPFDFHVELMKIILTDTPGVTYPAVIRSVGEAPKQFGNVVMPPAAAADDEFDFLHEMAYSEEDTEEFSEVSEVVADDEEEKKADEEDEVFDNEFF